MSNGWFRPERYEAQARIEADLREPLDYDDEVAWYDRAMDMAEAIVDRLQEERAFAKGGAHE